MNTLRNIRNMIYALKRQYGRKIILYRRTETVTNTKKGTQQHFYRPYLVKRAAKLPATLTREEHFDAKVRWRSYYDQSVVNILIDGRDIPIEVEEYDLIEMEGDQYVVSKVDNAGDGESFLVKMKAVEAFTRIQNFDLSMSNDLHYCVEVTNA